MQQSYIQLRVVRKTLLEKFFDLGGIMLKLEKLIDITLEHFSVVVAIKALSSLSAIGELALQPVTEKTVDFIFPIGVHRPDVRIPELVIITRVKLKLVDLPQELSFQYLVRLESYTSVIDDLEHHRYMGRIDGQIDEHQAVKEIVNEGLELVFAVQTGR
ncbi:hypothetical protein D3C81_1558270 [compost metagenome]